MLALNAHGAGHALSCLTAALVLGVAAAPAVQAATTATTLDAASCAALTAAAARGGGQFPLGRAACGLTGDPQPATLPAASHARQLQLYAPAATAAPVSPPQPAVSATARPLKPTTTQKRDARSSVSRTLPAPLVRAVQLAPEIDRVAAGNQIDPLLLHAIARIESQHNPAAVSHAGARGLMQVMPATGKRFGATSAESLHDVPMNLEVSARYLKFLKRRFPGDLQLVLAAYNAGEGAVERHGRRIPPYAETQAYVGKVLREYALLRNAAAGAGAGIAP